VEVVGELNDIVFRLQGADAGAVAPLHTAIRVLSDEERKNDAGAVTSVLAFVEGVSRSTGRSMDPGLAETVKRDASRIIRRLVRD
jgi:hypothetical protein